VAAGVGTDFAVGNPCQPARPGNPAAGYSAMLILPIRPRWPT